MSAIKPTHLGTWRLPSFDRHAQRIKRPIDWNAMEALAGLNEDGSFNTAKAKEYAPPLCDLIACCFVDAGNSLDGDAVDSDLVFDRDGFSLGDFICHIEGNADFGDDLVDTGKLPLFSLAGGGADMPVPDCNPSA